VSRQVLVTGATGKTGRRLMELLRQGDVPAVAASREAAQDRVLFDWTDRGTWDGALHDVGAVYLVAPMAADDPGPLMIDFVERALALGADRFVLLSASVLEAGGPVMGQVHQWLSQSGTGWAVLRPSWFMENFSEGPHCATIRDERAIYSASGQGRVPFLSAEDIARAAAAALTMEDPPDSDFVLTGPELLSFDDAAQRIGRAIGETVTHRSLSFDERVARQVAHGLSEAHAQTVALGDLVIAENGEDRLTNALADLVSAPPVTFDDFAAENAWRWKPTEAASQRQPSSGAT
jgi:ergot alkaloid biosynthesis protein